MSELALFGLNLFGDPVQPPSRGPVAEAFIEPPFSVLDARSGDWQDRKRAWAAMGIRGEVGRDTNTVPNGTVRSPEQDGCYRRSRSRPILGGSALNNSWQEKHPECRSGQGVPDAGCSIFDPVVCELVYRWFCPEAGQVVDPFAGGSVRGIVAGALSRKYWGCDLSAEQIAANEQQADEIVPTVRPVWVCGDSKDRLADAPEADFLFTCPPYGDLECYSDNPADLSTMSWTGFSIAYRLILLRAVQRLRHDRFACLVVGNFREPGSGLYRDLVSETIAAMRQAGASYYNDAVLITSVGSASMRVTKQFNAGRKLCKTHQNVLVFIKGDWRRAVKALGAEPPPAEPAQPDLEIGQ